MNKCDSHEETETVMVRHSRPNVTVIVVAAVVCVIAIVIGITSYQNARQNWADSYQALQDKYDRLEKKYADLDEKYDTLKLLYDTRLQVDSEWETEQTNETSEGAECYSDEYITIYYDHCGYEYGSTRIFFAVRNKTQMPLYILFESLAVDGWNLSRVVGGDEILPGCCGYVGVGVDDLSTYRPATLSGSFKVYDNTEKSFGKELYTSLFSEINVSN